MKKYFPWILGAVALLVFIHLCVFSLSGQSFVYASAEGSDAQEKLNQNIIEQIENLDLSALEAYIRSLGKWGEATIVERIFAYIQGNDFQYGDFWRDIFGILFEKFEELLPIFTSVTAIALLSGILSGISSGTKGNSATEFIYTICYITALIPLLGVLTRCFSQTSASVLEMQKQMQILFPIMLTLMAASGGALSVQLAQPAVAFFSTTIVTVIERVVLPFTLTIIVFSMADKLSKDLKVSRFGSFFKGMNKWIIGICVSVYGLFFSLHGITASTYDGIVRRVAKYAIGSGVPIVGGFLSGGLDLAVAGSVLIKNSLGSLGIVLMLSVLLEPVLLLIATSILLRLVSAITQPFGDGKISDFLGESAENLNYCTASVLLTGFMYFLTIIIFIASTEALL
jgi:stage III sporulation protein AE